MKKVIGIVMLVGFCMAMGLFVGDLRKGGATLTECNSCPDLLMWDEAL